MPKSVLKDKVLKRGIVSAWDIHFHFTDLAAKTIVFDTPENLKLFHGELVRRGISFTEKLGKGCRGVVMKLVTEVLHLDTLEFKCWEVDPKYFCIVLLIEGHMDIEVISHEAMHVGFAYDLRKSKDNKYYEPACDSSEEKVCYPAGVWVRQLARLMNEEGIRAVGGHSKKWRDSWCRESQRGYLAPFLKYFDDEPDTEYLQRYRRQCATLKRSRNPS